jgi:hypothetical protein
MGKNEKLLKKLKEDLLVFLLNFIIISTFSLTKSIYIDEAISFFCSKYYLTDCLYFDPSPPLFTFLLKISTLLLGFDVVTQRIFLAVFSSFSILVIIRAVEIYRKLKLSDKIFLSIIISFLPIIYSSNLVRPYVFSLMFSSVSFFHFLKFLKTNKKNYLFKSYLLDVVGGLFFYFNFFLILIKVLFLLWQRSIVFDSIKFLLFLSIFLLPFLFNAYIAYDAKIAGIFWYGNYGDYVNSFLLNFPIELFKHSLLARLPKIDFLSILIVLSQLAFFVCLFNKEKQLVKLFLLILVFILGVFLAFASQRLYLILSRQYISLTIPLLTLLIILFPFNLKFLVILPLTFLPMTYFNLQYIKYLWFYGPSYEVYEALPLNSSVITTPSFYSKGLWYYEMKNRKNISIFEPIDDYWFEKNISVFRYYKIDRSEYEPPIKVKIENLDNFIKVFYGIEAKQCKEIIKEIYSSEGKVIVCR